MIGGKYEKNMSQNLCEIIKEIPWQKIDFRNMQTKLNTKTEGDLEFFMLLKETSFQNLTFFARIHKKL